MKRFVLTLAIFLLSGFAVWSQDTEAAPNDPTVNENANACFAGGTMEGKCNVDFDGNGTIDDYEVNWAWECGWYMIRLDYGMLSSGQLPVRCQTLLAAPLLCFNHRLAGISLLYNGAPNSAGNLSIFHGLNCQGNSFATLNDSALIFANSLTEAMEICLELGAPYSLDTMTNLGYDSAPGIYGCDFH